jgi:CRISP-associated protein Cas1
MSASPVRPIRRDPFDEPDPSQLQRKPPQPAQYNWIRECFEEPAEQLTLDLPPPPEIDPAYDDQVSLLVTETGTQLFVSGFGLSLGKQSERIAIRHKRKTVAQIPFLRLQEVVIGARGVNVTSDIIEALCQRGIRLAFLTGTGRPYALLTSPLLTATVETRKAQLRTLDAAHGVAMARWIVAGKTRNQAKLLLYFARNRPAPQAEKFRAAALSIKQITKKVLALDGTSCAAIRPTLQGLEGAAGRMYWENISQMIPGSDGFSRHLPPVNVIHSTVNSALNYGYGILNSHVWGAVMNAGLEPFAGLIHTDRSGKPSLVLDLMEEFRQPVVDRPIFAWIAKGGMPQLLGGLLDTPSKEAVAMRVIGRLSSLEPHRGKNHQVRSIIQMQARLAGSAFRELKEYRPFSFQW